MLAMKTISFRIPQELADAVAESAANWRVGSESGVYRRVIEEWLRSQRHPEVRFVDGPAGRRAALVCGPDVWEAIAIAKSFDFDEAAIAEAYPWLSERRLGAARRYYEEFSDEIDAIIEENARIATALEEELELVLREASE